MTPKKTLSILAILALALVGCGSTEAEEEPQSSEEQQAQQNVDTTNAVYDETYSVVSDHVINEYGILETAELCDNFNNYEDDFDYDAFIDNIMKDAGVEQQAEPEDSPDYRGANDATDDAIYDTCEEYNSN